MFFFFFFSFFRNLAAAPPEPPPPDAGFANAIVSSASSTTFTGKFAFLIVIGYSDTISNPIIHIPLSLYYETYETLTSIFTPALALPFVLSVGSASFAVEKPKSE